MKVRVLAEAEAELRSAVLYYEEQQVVLGKDLRDRVSKVIHTVVGVRCGFRVTKVSSLREISGERPLSDFPIC